MGSFQGYYFSSNVVLTFQPCICLSNHCVCFSFAVLQAICSKYAITVESSSQFDRRVLNCLVNYYLNIDIFSPKVLLFIYTVIHLYVPLCFLCAHHSCWLLLLGNTNWMPKGIVHQSWTWKFNWYHHVPIQQDGKNTCRCSSGSVFFYFYCLRK